MWLTLSVPEKLKNLIFEMPIIPQTLNINNLRTTSAKSINLPTIRKLIEYSLKNVPVKAMFILTVFKILLSKCRLVLSPAQQGTGSERAKIWEIFPNVTRVLSILLTTADTSASEKRILLCDMWTFVAWWVKSFLMLLMFYYLYVFIEINSLIVTK